MDFLIKFANIDNSMTCEAHHYAMFVPHGYYQENKGLFVRS